MSITDVRYQAAELRSTLWNAQTNSRDTWRTFDWKLDYRLKEILEDQGYW